MQSRARQSNSFGEDRFKVPRELLPPESVQPSCHHLALSCRLLDVFPRRQKPGCILADHGPFPRGASLLVKAPRREGVLWLEFNSFKTKEEQL